MDMVTVSGIEQGKEGSISSITVAVPIDDRVSKQFKRPTHYLASFKGKRLDSDRQERVKGSQARNSLESISSRFSTSSFILEDQSQQQQQSEYLASSLDENEISQSGLIVSERIAAMLNFKPPSLDLAKLDEKASHLKFKEINLTDESECKQKEQQKSNKKLSSPSVVHSTSSGKVQAKSHEDEAPFMFAGIAASILGSFIGSVGFLCAKLLPDHSFRGSVTTLMIRGLFIVFLTGITSMTQGTRLKIRRDEIWVNLLRAIFGTCGVLGTFCAMQYISLGDTTALVFSSPVWTSLLSRMILKEKLQWIQLMALPSSLLGIVLIAHPALIVDVNKLSLTGSGPTTDSDSILHQPLQFSSSSNNTYPEGLVSSVTDSPLPTLLPQAKIQNDLYEQRWPGIVIALCTSLCVSCTYIVLKFRKNTPIQTTTFWYGVCMVSVSVILFLLFIDNPQVPTSLHEWILYTTLGITSWLSQCVIQWAFLYETAAVLSVVRTLDVALIFILSAIFIADEIYWTSVLGACIISISVASIMLNNWISSYPFAKGTNQNKESDLEGAEKGPIQSSREQVYHINLALEPPQSKKI